MENLDATKRLIIAVALIFVFFLFYDHFYYSKLRQDLNTSAGANASATMQASAPNLAPSSTSTNSAPNATANQAPAQNQMQASSGGAFKAPGAALSASGDVILRVSIKDANLSVDSLGRISVASYNEKGREKPVSLFAQTHTKPLELRFANAELNEAAFKTPYVSSTAYADASSTAQKVILEQRLKDLTLTKELTFYPNGNYTLSVRASKPETFFITPGFRPDLEVDALSVHGSLVLEKDETIEVIEDGDAKGDEVFTGAKMVSAFDRYYATLFYDFNASFDVYYNKVADDSPLAFVKANGSLALNGYIGPKNVGLLKSIDPKLIHAVEYGIFTFLAAPLFKFLDFINAYVGNWGWSIIVFIIIVKIILYPLSYKGMVSMAKLKDLAPKIKELQAKYKNEPQKMQMQMMDLYKKHGANPMGGCFPILIQIPIFFAIYRVLVNAIELRGSEWLYINDLSAMDPYFILPILMGASMFFQQKITPTNFTDPMQEKIMKYLPVIFTVFFVTFPAGLVLYWFANNILSIIQQYLVNKSIEKHKVIKND